MTAAITLTRTDELAALRAQVQAARHAADAWRREADRLDDDATHGDPEDYTDAEREQLRADARTYRDLAASLDRRLNAAQGM